jgi:nuclear GTP-binding protein
VELDKHIRLIDSPGVVLAAKGQLDPSELSLKNVVRVETLIDPITPIHAILRRCSIKVVCIFEKNI